MTGEPCFSIVRKPKGFESANEMTLKRRIEGNSWEKCQYALEDLLQNLLDGEKFPTNLMMSVINRYQMNKFTGDVGNQDKRIKKLLYILWECLPKRGPDGKFLDRMVMVCGAFDNDLKHPNEFVCGTVCRTLGKTREPEVMRELVHSIEKCLKSSHPYRQKNAVLAIAKIFKNFPDLNPSAPKLISEYLMETKEDECKRAALQALLEIDPEEAKPYLHSSNIQDIHVMNTSIQLLFVEIIQKVFKKESEEAQDYINILSSLIRLSSSPSVRYQAASTLMKFSRDPNAIKLVASCFIDICAKDSDNNVKLIALSSLMKLRRINGADRVIRGSIMDILFILQSASDVELQEKILKLTFDLISPLNVSGVVAALRQEIAKNASDPEKGHYRRLLVGATHNIAERYPKSIVEYDLLDTLFDLLISSSTGEKLASEMILLFKVFMTKNPSNRAIVLEKIQDCFNIIRNSPATHRGLIQLLGEFSETKEQIEKTFTVLKESLGELPIVGSELRRIAQREDEASGGAQDSKDNGKQSASNGDVDMVTKGMKRLVTADGSYAAQSAINYQITSKIGSEEHPPLRSYYLENKFDTASVLCYALLKMACRYQQSTDVSKGEAGKMIAKFMFMIASILNLGHSNLSDSEGNTIHINNDHSENLMLSLTVMQSIHSEKHSEVSKIMRRIVTDDIRSQLNLAVKNVDKEFMQDSFRTQKKTTNMDDTIHIGLLSTRGDDFEYEEHSEDDSDLSHISMPDMFGEIPLTGSIDAIYAYCVFDINQYDVGLKIHLENRASHTLENVTLELAARGENASKYISRPDPIVLGPRATACITSNIKVVSAENRRLFGSISYDDTSRVGSDDKEQVIMLNDVSVNITDYIRPATTTYDEFREVWRDCEWENKVSVKTKLTNLKEYLMQLVTATNMRCVTAERCLSGDCMFLSANMYARSAFGEDALVNVSIEKESPQSGITGTVKIRSRSQGMAVSLGEKITSTQLSAR